MVFVVRERTALLTKVIPFFEAHPLISAKQEDFESFAEIVRAMASGQHLTAEGFDRLCRKALKMNGGGRYRRIKYLEPNP